MITKCKCGACLTVLKVPNFQYWCYGGWNADQLVPYYFNTDVFYMVLCDSPHCKFMKPFPDGHKLYECDGKNIIERERELE